MSSVSQSGSVLLVNALPGTPSYLFQDPIETLVARHADEIEPLLAALDDAASRGLYAAGFLAYEAGYALEPSLRSLLKSDGSLLAWFGLYTQRKEFTYREAASSLTMEEPSIALDAASFAEKIARIKQHIERGDTYQVNLTTQLRWKHALSADDLLRHSLAVQPVEFGALVHIGERQLVSASPELFFRREARRITTRPMKGTVKRGKNLAEDEVLMQWLAGDEKNRAENLMIVDLLRNDLGRICTTGSVRVDHLFAVERYPTLHQMTSTIRGELKPDVSYVDIFRSLFPSGSIVGAPKIKTMELIHALEEEPRGAYTGCIGYISPNQEACFSVAIRTLVLEGDQTSMGVGAGITYDSDAVAEYEETRLKGSFLQQDARPFQLIETLLWDGKRFHFLGEHLFRLQQSAVYFSFVCDLESVKAALSETAKSLQTDYRVRLLLDRNGSVSVTAAAIAQEERPWRVLLAEQRTSSQDVFLQHKTTRRALYDEQMAIARSRGFDEVLFLNELGHITEGCITNFFVERNGQLITPPLTDGVLPGVLRAHLKPKEQSMRLEDLLPGDRLYLGNSVRGLISIEYLER